MHVSCVYYPLPELMQFSYVYFLLHLLTEGVYVWASQPLYCYICRGPESKNNPQTQIGSSANLSEGQCPFQKLVQCSSHSVHPDRVPACQTMFIRKQNRYTIAKGCILSDGEWSGGRPFCHPSRHRPQITQCLCQENGCNYYSLIVQLTKYGFHNTTQSEDIILENDYEVEVTRRSTPSAADQKPVITPREIRTKGRTLREIWHHILWD